ncbi:cell surface protein SprA [Carboxylicivirga sp. A043]|uniref:T9SS outer membrane translocon Sov/SprA n=1 Tax=Carboxylicivirga litoralis TaxID=2816963 RepID=UPI0021CB8D20|nr:cell surface protein SprA [Carboxylicivirga sp. A043]MCU4155432.1 cell surface protein SprA [Carboxylicivirga sp. A043]
MKYIIELLLVIFLFACDNGNKGIKPNDPIDVTTQLVADVYWSLSSTPARFEESNLLNDLTYGFNRSKISFYNVEHHVFHQENATMPAHIAVDEEQRMHHLSREIYEQELYPEREVAYGQPSTIACLNIAFYPSERGPYNYDSHNVNFNGTLKQPEQRWGGMMQSIKIKENERFIEFWMMEPFTSNENASMSGKMCINLGLVSEDILKDNLASSELALYVEPNLSKVLSTWGYIVQNFNVSQFDDSNKRMKQDVGFDGLGNAEEEASFFSDFTNAIENKISNDAFDKLKSDPSSDNYHYFLGNDYDQKELSIVDRYKDYCGPDGNSFLYTTPKSNFPDKEDLNDDGQLSTEERYNEFEININAQQFEIDKNYIDDIVYSDVDDFYGRKVKFYHFRIPIDQPSSNVGGSVSKNEMKFIRLYLTGFNSSVILRLVDLKLSE